MRVGSAFCLTVCIVAGMACGGGQEARGRELARPNVPPLRPTSSENFVVQSVSGKPLPSGFLDSCERLRADLQAMWFAGSPRPAWRPRCEVVVHASRASYQQAAGRGSEQTYGSSLIRFDRGQVALRRIDVLLDADGRATALPHELAHVVLAERFAGRQPPRWVDEGVATLADSGEKRRLHLRDCQQALHAGTAFSLAELVQLERCASYAQATTFYGQSLSLVSYLIERDSPVRFLALVERAMDVGYEKALQQIYAIDNLTHLERQWREYALMSRPAADHVQLTMLGGSRETEGAPQLTK